VENGKAGKERSLRRSFRNPAGNRQRHLSGSGLSLFKSISDRIDLKLIRTKIFGCGAITLYYERAKK
jgi:hypothetical protein